jgi:hypothetical protein
MLARSACASVRAILSPQSATAVRSRAFAVGAASQSPARAPALADITPDSAASFIEKQKDFRDGLVAAQKRKEQEESASHLFLWSRCDLLTSSIAEDARAREQESGRKKGGALSSLIYGTPEGRELDKDIERSFSQVLARGKYVHSIVFHEVKPDKVDEYTELVGNWYPKMASIPENKVHLVGSWRTEVGDCNTFGTSNDCSTPCLCQPTNRANSTYLGVPALRGISSISAQYPVPCRVLCIRCQTQDSDQLQTHLAHAGVLLLANDTAASARWLVRTALVHITPW